MKKSILALSTLCILFTACKKDKDEPAAVTPTVANLSGSYKLDKITAMSGNTETPMPEGWMEACEKDDIYKLNANLSYEQVDAGTVCDPSGGISGSWKLNSATSIELDGDPYTIRKFDGKSLELTEVYLGATFVTYFVKQ